MLQQKFWVPFNIATWTYQWIIIDFLWYILPTCINKLDMHNCLSARSGKNGTVNFSGTQSFIHNWLWLVLFKILKLLVKSIYAWHFSPQKWSFYSSSINHPLSYPLISLLLFVWVLSTSISNLYKNDINSWHSFLKSIVLVFLK